METEIRESRDGKANTPTPSVSASAPGSLGNGQWSFVSETEE